MASATSVLAIIRAARPQFRSRHEKVVFAAHAVFLASGYRLVGVGGDLTPTAVSSSTEDIPIDGWNSNSELFGFQYISDAGNCCILVKAVPIADIVLLNAILCVPWGQPATCELPTDKFCTDSPDHRQTLINLDKLVDRVLRMLLQLEADMVAGNPTDAQRSPAGVSYRTQGKAVDSSYPGYQQRPPPTTYYPPDSVLYDDYGPIPPRYRVPADLVPPSPMQGGPMQGGGMLVGPDSELFANRRRHPELHGASPGFMPPGIPPGTRWDPVSPQGLEGWRPEDYQRGYPRRPDPDIGLPPPGRGTDWDAMYG